MLMASVNSPQWAYPCQDAALMGYLHMMRGLLALLVPTVTGNARSLYKRNGQQ